MSDSHTNIPAELGGYDDLSQGEDMSRKTVRQEADAPLEQAPFQISAADLVAYLTDRFLPDDKFHVMIAHSPNVSIYLAQVCLKVEPRVIN